LLLLVQMRVVLVCMNRSELPIHPDPRQRVFLTIWTCSGLGRPPFAFYVPVPRGVTIICAARTLKWLPQTRGT